MNGLLGFYTEKIDLESREKTVIWVNEDALLVKHTVLIQNQGLFIEMSLKSDLFGINHFGLSLVNILGALFSSWNNFQYF